MSKKRQRSGKTGDVSCFWKNLILYLALLGACLTYAFYYGGFFPYTLLYLTLSLPFMSLLHLLITAKMLRMSERLNARVFIKGDTVSYRFTLNNSSIFYMPYIDIRMHEETQLIFDGLKDMRISVAPFSSRHIKYDIPLMLRGKYGIGVERVRLNDMLGLFSYTFHPSEKKQILVKPRILKKAYQIMPNAHAYEGQQSQENRKQGNDELSDIRKYVYGDSLKKIHWKLSAKVHKTLVRETLSEPENNAVVFLNLNSTIMPDSAQVPDKETLIREDWLIEELVAEINHLYKNNIPIKLLLNQQELKSIEISSLADFNATYEYLAVLDFDHSEYEDPDLSCLMECEGSLKYVFTLTLDEKMVDKILKMNSKGTNLTLYYIDFNSTDNGMTHDIYDKLKELFEKNGIRAVRLDPSLTANNMQFDSKEKLA